MAVKEVEALNLARKIAMFNGEIVYYVKNSLKLMTPTLQKWLEEESEKYRTMIKSKFPDANPDILIATVRNNRNHDVMKLEPDMIKDELMKSDMNA